MNKILIVCTANICRSPYATAVLASQLSRLPNTSAIQIMSAGTKALPGASLCKEVESSLRRIEPLAEFPAAHNSSLLDLAAVEAAGLILVMELAQRSMVAKISPSARRRTFTLREAVALTHHVESAPQGSPPAQNLAQNKFGDLDFPQFVAELNSRRGRAPISLGATTPFWNKIGRPDPFDIPDGHNSTDRKHRSALKQVEEAALAFAAVLTPFCA